MNKIRDKVQDLVLVSINGSLYNLVYPLVKDTVENAVWDSINNNLWHSIHRSIRLASINDLVKDSIRSKYE
jgi:hypothetical protein